MSHSDPAELRDRAGRLVAAGAVGACVAHELRNSLAVAESSLFLAKRDVDDRARLLRHLDQIGAELRKAHGVIGSVLGLARGEPPNREPHSLRRLIEIARHALTLPPNIRFEAHVAPDDLMVHCDPVLLERVFSNLYINAIEALHGRGGTIATRARPDGERVFVEVEDDGPGLDASICGCVFEPLATTKTDGTGLGLALTKTIVEAHGGEIAWGKGPSGGCAFRLWLPNG